MPVQYDPVLLSNVNMERYGFLRFGDATAIRKDGANWIREIHLEAGTEKKPAIRRFLIPPDLQIPLVQRKKIADWPNFRIKPLGYRIEDLHLLSARAGWNQTIDDLTAISSLDSKGSLLATVAVDGIEIALGSGIAAPVGPNRSWIGMILVHPEVRRQGIAAAIMQTLILHARLHQRNAILGLDATPSGGEVYRRLGFVESFAIQRCSLQLIRRVGDQPALEIRPGTSNERTGYRVLRGLADHSTVFKLLSKLPETKNIMAFELSQPVGLIMSRPGRIKPYIGPLMADRSEIANWLLHAVLDHWYAQGYTEVFMDIPTCHLTENGFLTGIGIAPIRRLSRMYQMITSTESDRLAQQLTKDNARGRYQTPEVASGINKMTTAHLNKEKRKVIPYLYGISGPEIG